MKNLVKKVSSIIVIALFIMGCSKDDDDTAVVVPPTNAELIIGTWKFTAGSDAGIVYTLNECQLKITYIFDGTHYFYSPYATNDSFGFVEGVAKCSKVPITTDKYSINGNIINFKNPSVGFEDYFEEIVELNATTLVSKYVDGDGTICIQTYTKIK